MTVSTKILRSSDFSYRFTETLYSSHTRFGKTLRRSHGVSRYLLSFINLSWGSRCSNSCTSDHILCSPLKFLGQVLNLGWEFTNPYLGHTAYSVSIPHCYYNPSEIRSGRQISLNSWPGNWEGLPAARPTQFHNSSVDKLGTGCWARCPSV